MKIGRVIKYNIKIEPTANYGFVAHVGCALLAFADTGSLVNGLSDYLNDPHEYEKAYGTINTAVIEEPQPETPKPNTERGR